MNRGVSDLVVQTWVTPDFAIVEAFLGRANPGIKVHTGLRDGLLQRGLFFGPVPALERNQGRRPDILLNGSSAHLNRLEVVPSCKGFFPEFSRVSDCRCQQTLTVEVRRGPRTIVGQGSACGLRLRCSNLLLFVRE